jgi:hypothetical protein
MTFWSAAVPQPCYRVSPGYKLCLLTTPVKQKFGSPLKIALSRDPLPLSVYRGSSLAKASWHRLLSSFMLAQSECYMHGAFNGYGEPCAQLILVSEALRLHCKSSSMGCAVNLLVPLSVVSASAEGLPMPLCKTLLVSLNCFNRPLIGSPPGASSPYL